MSGKIDLYNLGESGINVSVSPIHTKPGDLIQCQNAVPDPTGSEGGLRKRGGLAKLNSVALSGAVKGVGFVPFDSEAGSVSGQTGDLTQTIYVGVANINAGAVFWRTSTNGTTWANATAPTSAAWLTGTYLGSENNSQRMLSLENRLYYCAGGPADINNANGLTFREWDGTTDRLVAQIPAPRVTTGSNKAVLVVDMVVHEGKIYLAVVDDIDGGGVGRGRVMEWDRLTGALRRVGEEIYDGTVGTVAGENPAALVSWMGRLWLGTSSGDNLGTGRLYWIRPGVDEAWTQDQTFVTASVVSLVVFLGNLYVGTQNDGTAATAALIRKRTTTGTWSTVETGSSAQPYNGYYGLVVYSAELYAFYSDNDNNDSPPRVSLVRVTSDGTTWSTDVNIKTTFGASSKILRPTQSLVVGSDLFVVGTDSATGSLANTGIRSVFRKSGGTWSVVDTLVTDCHFCVGFIRS